MGRTLFRPAALAVIVTIASWGVGALAAYAGDGNVLYLKQDSGSYGIGESFQSDQSNSTNSSIGGFDAPALQLGSGDTATLTIDSTCPYVSGSCGHADLTQDSDYQAALAAHPDAPWWLGGVLAGVSGLFGPNSAAISVTGQGSAAISQYGFGNRATIVANDGSGSINQVGLGNAAKLTVTPLVPGLGVGKVVVNQVGLSNSVNLVASTPAGTSSSYTQLGAYLAPTSMVITSTSSFVITHSGFGSYTGH